MFLVRAWRRQLLGGLGAAIIVPATLMAALAVLAVAGGFSGLGALGQAFSGPTLPTVQGSAPSSTHHGRPISTVVLAALASPGPATPASNGGGGAEGHPRAPSAPRTRGGGEAPGPVARRPAPPSTQPSSPSPHPTLTDELVGAGASATGQLPSPAGPAASGALQSAGATVDQVLPVPAPAPPPAP